jgi:hypothetical protein
LAKDGADRREKKSVVSKILFIASLQDASKMFGLIDETSRGLKRCDLLYHIKDSEGLELDSGVAFAPTMPASFFNEIIRIDTGMFWEGHPSTVLPRKVPLEDYSHHVSVSVIPNVL